MQNQILFTKEKVLSYLEHIFSSNEKIVKNILKKKLTPNIDNIFIKIITGGHHGNRSAPFEVTLEDKINNLSNQINYHLSYNLHNLTNDKYNKVDIYEISQIIGKKYINNVIDTISLFSDEEGCEYGGKYNYQIIAIPTIEVFKDLLDNKDFFILNSVYEEINKKDQIDTILISRKKIK